ncbi:MAG: phosphate ABC transporter ATP-binding protein PstB [Cyanobacteria bacterium P01_D01_bin.44]
MPTNVGTPFLSEGEVTPKTILQADNVTVHYGKALGVRDVSMEIPKNRITALIGPSGCGKSTLIRCFNRLNDLIPGARVDGKITFNGVDINGELDITVLRRQVGMVFQKPNPFSKSIYSNIAFGAKINGYLYDLDELVEQSLQRVGLWGEVKDRLNESGHSLSGGQQQRLCIARAIAVEPEVILMDEPCSSLDPLSTLRIEELMQELKQKYTLVIVTHNMQQAARVSDMTAFFNADADARGNRFGYLVEYDKTQVIFNTPQQEATLAYVSGRFG